MKKIITSCAFLFACFFAIATETQGASSTVEGFDGGTDGGFIGNVFFEAAGGNPDGNARHLAPDLFFNSLRTGGLNEPANPNFLGDYSSYSSVTFGFDVRTDVLRNFNGPISREIGIALRDRDLQGPNGDAGIFFTFTTPLNEALQDNWTTYSVTIEDPNSPTLPAGWIGFGDDDPNTFEPILPTGASFASVLASVDEFEITGAIPGFFFGPANMDIRIDNVTVTVPEPSGCLLVFLGLLAASRSRL